MIGLHIVGILRKNTLLVVVGNAQVVVKLVMNYSICTRYSTPRFEDVQQKLLQVDLIGWRLLFILQMIIIKEIDL